MTIENQPATLPRVLLLSDDDHLRKLPCQTETGNYDLLIHDQTSTNNEEPYEVVIIDDQTSGIDAVSLARQTYQTSQETLCIVLVSEGDHESMVAALNENGVFQVLMRPCPRAIVQGCLSAALKQQKLIAAEHELYSKTLVGCIRMLTNVLSFMHPDAFARASRVHRLARQLASLLNIKRAWEIELAAMISQVGWILEMVELENLADELATDTDFDPATPDLIADIPGLESVWKVVSDVEESSDRNTGAVSLETQILRLTLEYDLTIGNGISPIDAARQLRRSYPEFDPRLHAALREVCEAAMTMETTLVSPVAIPEGAILADDLKSINGQLLLRRGQEIGAALRSRIQKWSRAVGLEPVTIITKNKKLCSVFVDA